MVNFENGTTPINDTNLNKMQTDLQEQIDKLKGTILYEDEEGTTGENTITLNENISNYQRAKIVYDCCSTSGSKYAYGSIKEIDLTGNLTSFLISETLSAEHVYMTFNLNGNILSITRNRHLNAAGEPTVGNYIYITKIIGYK